MSIARFIRSTPGKPIKVFRSISVRIVEFLRSTLETTINNLEILA